MGKLWLYPAGLGIFCLLGVGLGITAITWLGDLPGGAVLVVFGVLGFISCGIMTYCFRNYEEDD